MQVMLISPGHSPRLVFAKATRAVGKEATFPTVLDTVASCTHLSLTQIMCFLKNFSGLMRTSQKKTTGQEELPEIAAQGDQTPASDPYSALSYTYEVDKSPKQPPDCSECFN